MNYLSIELQKTKRRGIWLVPTALFFFLMIWLGHSYTGSNGSSHTQYGWMDVLYYTPLLNAILIPTAIAVLASRIIDMEHKGNMWKQLETMQSRRALFLAKTAPNDNLDCILQSGGCALCGALRKYGGTVSDVSSTVPDFAVYCTVGTLRRGDVCGHGLE